MPISYDWILIEKWTFLTNDVQYNYYRCIKHLDGYEI